MTDETQRLKDDLEAEKKRRQSAEEALQSARDTLARVKRELRSAQRQLIEHKPASESASAERLQYLERVSRGRH